MNKQKQPRRPGPAKEIQDLRKEVENLRSRLEIQEMITSALETEFNRRFSILGRSEADLLDLKTSKVVPLFGGYDYE